MEIKLIFMFRQKGGSHIKVKHIEESNYATALHKAKYYFTNPKYLGSRPIRGATV